MPIKHVLDPQDPGPKTPEENLESSHLCDWEGRTSKRMARDLSLRDKIESSSDG